MEMIKTGLYKKIIIRKKEEITISKSQLEKVLENIKNSNEEKKQRFQNKMAGYKQNMEAWKRTEKTGYMLLEGKTVPEIAKELGLVNSTIEKYISHLISYTQNNKQSP